VFCAFEIIQLFFVVFYVVRFVHKFGFRPDIKGEKGTAVLETRVSERIYMYNPHCPSIMVLYLRYIGQLNSHE
jgi:hypothetical protein